MPLLRLGVAGGVFTVAIARPWLVALPPLLGRSRVIKNLKYVHPDSKCRYALLLKIFYVKGRVYKLAIFILIVMHHPHMFRV